MNNYLKTEKYIKAAFVIASICDGVICSGLSHTDVNY
jgi:hypothetical protein